MPAGRRGVKLAPMAQSRFMPPLSAIPLLILAAIVSLFCSCIPSSAYQRAAAVSDQVLPVFKDALELADDVREVPGGQDALNAAAALITAWNAKNESGFNAAVPCVEKALRDVSRTATMLGRDALAVRLERVSNVLQGLDSGAVCADPGRPSDRDAGPQVPPRGSPLDGGADGGSASLPLDRAPLRPRVETVLVLAPAPSRTYRSAADGEQDRLSLYRAHGDAPEGTQPRSIIRASEHGNPTWGA